MVYPSPIGRGYAVVAVLQRALLPPLWSTLALQSPRCGSVVEYQDRFKIMLPHAGTRIDV